MTQSLRARLMKPTTKTPFHIDFDWWQNNDQNWRIHLKSCLCEEHRTSFEDMDVNQKFDWIDPETAVIQSVDGLQHILMVHCSKQENFITSHTSLVDSVFRIFLSNGNTPLSSEQLQEKTGKSPRTILSTLAGAKVYKGIRPVQI